jgi:hypothetical protein
MAAWQLTGMLAKWQRGKQQMRQTNEKWWCGDQEEINKCTKLMKILRCGNQQWCRPNAEVTAQQ